MKKFKASIFGDSPKTTYLYANLIKKKLNKDTYDVLVIDSLDGYTLMPFARNGLNVEGYETDAEYIKLLKERLKKEKLTNVNIYDTDYYKNNSNKKYDFIYAYKSLNRENNLSMNDKVQAILNSVKNGGYLYIYYLMAVDEEDYINYPSNRYLRSYEITKMLSTDFNILFCKERDKLRNNNRIGYVFAYKKTKKMIKHNYNYNIKIGIV